MVKAIRFHKPGGPEVMQLEDIELAAPAAGQIQIRHTAIGLNYIDTYHRSGLYPLALPHGLGMEGAGTVAAVGDGVRDFAVGDRVAYAAPPPGSYSEARNIEASKVVKVPAGVDDKTAAAMMLKGMTAQYLIRQVYKVQAGDTILIHAAAGGVGLIVCQWAKALGATVIGTVGSDAKAELAKANGCDHPIVYSRDDFVEKTLEITGGKKLPVVYDSIGKDTWPKSLDVLRPRGMMVSFGQSSGPIPPVDLGIFAAKGSLQFTRPTLMTFTATKAGLDEMAADLFAAVSSGKVKINIEQTYALADIVKAHQDLEGRKTTGSTVILP
ncbi:quinone oxidoreductase [Thalassobaculum fulvum]|uniref:Quinone oxidoreductase n=1 Tax=Thalassobaculum fulvum TaxID=1633335 RepID=A0A919CMB7_9PROT|nr:quinone oxidoreductase [Thalassobaculum fulvum]GHD39678.1 quinone oxidoreductase [Thalassobaculum fulvum]